METNIQQQHVILNIPYKSLFMNISTVKVLLDLIGTLSCYGS